jgi:hypothetical protein
MEPLMHSLLIAHLMATTFMTGLIWFVQVVHYPLFAGVGDAAFTRYEADHMRRTTWVVGPAMLAEAALASFIGWSTATPLAWAGLALLAFIWVSTWLLQVPCHNRLCGGFERAVARRLVSTNWLRTIGWSARCVIASLMLM